MSRTFLLKHGAITSVKSLNGLTNTYYFVFYSLPANKINLKSTLMSVGYKIPILTCCEMFIMSLLFNIITEKFDFRYDSIEKYLFRPNIEPIF